MSECNYQNLYLYDSLMVSVDLEIGIGTHFTWISLHNTNSNPDVYIYIYINIYICIYIYVYVCTMSMTPSSSTTITWHLNYSRFHFIPDPISIHITSHYLLFIETNAFISHRLSNLSDNSTLMFCN